MRKCVKPVCDFKNSLNKQLHSKVEEQNKEMCEHCTLNYKVLKMYFLIKGSHEAL